jgi:hypothetical protein
MTPKELIKLAQACRKAGISHYKCGDLEFTLGEDPRVNTVATVKPQTQGDVETEELSDDALLLWSVMDIPKPDAPTQ